MPVREKILVLVDTSEADKTLLKFTEIIANASDTREIHLFNSIRTMNIPGEVLKDIPDIKEKAFEDRKKQITATMTSTLPEHLIAITQIHIEEGAPSKGILRFIEEHDIDLLMMGRHKDFRGGGVLSNRLARRATCSLFIVPEEAVPNQDHLLVPCDFSPHSKIAMETAITIARKYKTSKLVCQNVYSVPTSWRYSGKTYEEFGEIMKNNAKKSFKKFMKDIDHEGMAIEEVYSQDVNDNPVTDIMDFALETKPGVIIIGVKGRSATTALFIGSKAELLIQQNRDIPMLIVRPKGKNEGILELLKEI